MSEGSNGGCCGGQNGASGGSGGSCGCQTKSQRLMIPQGTAKELVALPIGEILARYRRGVGNYDARIFSLTEEQIDRAFLPEAKVGRWSVRMVLGHIADAELAFVHRMRRAIAEDKPVLSLWDENAFIDSGLYGLPREVSGGDPASLIGGFVAVLHTMRIWSHQWLSGLKPEQFDRVAMHPERGEQRVRDILAYAVWHAEHHSRFLQLKCDAMLGVQEEAEPLEVGGGGGCCGGKGHG